MPRIPVFYYHSIGNIGPQTLARGEFVAHLEHLRRLSFNTLTFSDLINRNYDENSRNAVFTFDDGLLDNYDNAFPILQDYGCKATFFIIAGFDDIVRWVNPKTSKWSDEEKTGYSIRYPSMQKHHRDDLLRHGMEIGCHSMTHPKLNKISRASLNREIIQSKTLLEQQHGVEIKAFCYPKGRYNETVIECLEHAGYKGACTTLPNFYDANTKPFECGRFLIENRWLFGKMLELAIAENRVIKSLLTAISPLLKLKNNFF